MSVYALYYYNLKESRLLCVSPSERLLREIAKDISLDYHHKRKKFGIADLKSSNLMFLHIEKFEKNNEIPKFYYGDFTNKISL